MLGIRLRLILETKGKEKYECAIRDAAVVGLFLTDLLRCCMALIECVKTKMS